jgi:hypothetical protein
MFFHLNVEQLAERAAWSFEQGHLLNTAGNLPAVRNTAFTPLHQDAV